ncbi:MAG: alpha/beta hydrolase [Deltaproteobacteria bacterium]|nr:alpha/beta hydrolase [Deltaproteobacteria bacterium]
MPLDPQTKSFLDQIASMGGPALNEVPVEMARTVSDSMAQWAGPGPDVAHVDNRKVPGPAGDIPVRIYVPGTAAAYPVLVYFHGGGWVIGSLESHDSICRTLANRAACMVVSVDYRLAPEHKFPAAAEDAYAATQWVAAAIGGLGGDPRRIAIGGDSAGGNLTAVVAQLARDRRGPRLVFQLLIYPVTDAARDTASYRENGDGYLLTRAMMDWFFDHYMTGDADGTDARLSPLRSENLQGLPPALVITAEFDPLRDEGERYAQRLREAKVPVTLSRYDGMIHGFFGMSSLVDKAKQAVDEAATALRKAFAVDC